MTKKLWVVGMACMLSSMNLFAQGYHISPYRTAPRTPVRHYDYNSGRTPARGRAMHYWNYSPYVGLRIGPSFSTVNSDDKYLDGGNMKAGVNVGLSVGLPLTQAAPLYFEPGLYFTQKGGNGRHEGDTFHYNLDYLEVPLVLKYRAPLNEHLSIDPYLGMYGAVGVSGKIKNYGQREAYNSFSSSDKNSFRRGDAGIKIGCGVSYDLLYVDLSYDWGLANICHDGFDTSHNSALILIVGLNL